MAIHMKVNSQTIKDKVKVKKHSQIKLKEKDISLITFYKVKVLLNMLMVQYIMVISNLE